MYCDVPEAAYYLGYASPASLYRLLKAGLLKEHVEMHHGLTPRLSFLSPYIEHSIHFSF